MKTKPEELIKEKLFKPDKTSLAYKLAERVYQAVVAIVGKRAIKKPEEVVLEHPANPEHGDWATNVALTLFGKKNVSVNVGERITTPLDLANQIVNAFRSQGLPDFIAKVEVAKPGFINFWLSQKWLGSQAERVIKEKDGFGQGSILKGKKILLEHTSPNPQTTIMLGHLRNNFLGMGMANILEFLGAKVTKDCIVNDRGIHLCRSIFGYLVFGRKRVGLKKNQLLKFRKVTDKQINSVSAKVNWRQLLNEWKKKRSNWWRPKELGLKPDHANLIWYVLGSRAYKLSEEIEKQVKEILFQWESEEIALRKKKTKTGLVWSIWKQILKWSDKGYQETYKRVGSVHNHVWKESDHYWKGKEIIFTKEGRWKRVFDKSEGAIITNLEKYSLPNTVVVKADGTALYITQDLALTKLKTRKFPSDLYIWDIGLEQNLYLQQLFAVCEQLGIAKRKDLFHLSYALINFRGGKKMSTRRGDVVMADEVLDELHHRAVNIIKSSDPKLRGKMSRKQLNDLAETVALGGIKYSLLRYGRETTIQFDIEESLALEGNSGPYLQYTFARCQSVLEKAKKHLRGGRVKSDVTSDGPSDSSEVGSPEEISLLRTLYQFPEVIREAAQNFAPNLICNFLFDLAQKYNLFYNRHSILKAGEPELVEARLALTAATGQILKNGLGLLGIETPERM